MGKIPFGFLGPREIAHAPVRPSKRMGSWATGLKGKGAKAQIGRWFEAHLPLRATGCRQTDAGCDVDLAAPPRRHEQSQLRPIGRVVSGEGDDRRGNEILKRLRAPRRQTRSPRNRVVCEDRFQLPTSHMAPSGVKRERQFPQR